MGCVLIARHSEHRLARSERTAVGDAGHDAEGLALADDEGERAGTQY